jgi:outer membrane protein OmpA-like peptidoglycan-associated protein
MKTKLRTVRAFSAASAFVVASAIAIGCSHTIPPELADAQRAYQAAEQDPGAQLVPRDMEDAKQSLRVAERTFAMHGDSPATRDFSYIALRRSMSAKAKAQLADALHQRQMAEADLERARHAEELAEASDLERRRSMLAAEQQAEHEREATLAKIRDVKAERTDKGLVLTVSGSVLFASGKSELLPSARDRLREVATALKDDSRSISVVGYTDSTGSQQLNERLSRERAESVKAFLVQQGIADDRISTAGKGEADPIASNATPEGRADNRRVELILPER